MTGVVEQESLFLTDLGRRVRHARTVRGLSRKVLSQTSGLSERYIAQLEGGQGNVSIILLRRVANAMGVRLDDLIAGQDLTPDWQVDAAATADQLRQLARELEGLQSLFSLASATKG